MRRISRVGFVVVLALVFVASCSDDDNIVSPGSPYQDLTLRDHVLVNLELACNQRSLEHYRDLFDAEFVFRFSRVDLVEGNVPYGSWDGASELVAMAHMFDPAYAGTGASPVKKIDMNLVYEAGEDKWTEVTSAGPQKTAGETWYQKTVFYSFEVNAGDLNYAGRNGAVFVVKPVDVGGVTQWRIVEWYDAPVTPLGASATPSIKETSWGAVKSRYCGDCRYRELTERDQVLANLEAAYADRNIERYDELLDPDFVFFFSDFDFENGYVPYPQWDRPSEIGATTSLFDPYWSKPPLEPVIRIDLYLDYDPGEVTWTEVVPSDPVKYPDEIWYQKTVTYSLYVPTASMAYLASNVQASFTVRWAMDLQGHAHWRIVEWRDDTGVNLEGPTGSTHRSPLVPPVMTWGRIKSVYSG